MFTMICKSIIVEVRVISQAKGKVNNSYLNIVYYAFQTKKKTNPIIVLYISRGKINMAHKAIKIKHHRLNMHELSCLQIA